MFLKNKERMDRKMNLQYKGVNHRGRVEWVELDLIMPAYPKGIAMEEWQVVRYRRFVEDILPCIGRELTKDELHSVQWLSGMDECTQRHFTSIIKSAFEHGKQSGITMEDFTIVPGYNILTPGQQELFQSIHNRHIKAFGTELQDKYALGNITKLVWDKGEKCLKVYYPDVWWHYETNGDWY